MKLKRCLGSEIPSPAEGKGIFYLDQETNNLKLKKSDETISWDLVGVDKYKDVDAETARLCHILENDDTPGFDGKILIQFINNGSVTVPINTGYYPEMEEDNKDDKADAYRTSDGKFYLASELTEATYHTFSKECTDKYVIAYYYKDSTSRWSTYCGILDGVDYYNTSYIERIICYNMNFCTHSNPYVYIHGSVQSYTLINCKTYDESIGSKFKITERKCKRFICY